MTTGSVKWFNNAKGYGFITNENIDGDIFVHYSQIIGDGFKTLREGESVEFILRRGAKGYHAANVVRTDPEQQQTRPEPERPQPRG
jgi:CspA family cold shock protein